jgi:hypothetical protein
MRTTVAIAVMATAPQSGRVWPFASRSSVSHHLGTGSTRRGSSRPLRRELGGGQEVAASTCHECRVSRGRGLLLGIDRESVARAVMTRSALLVRSARVVVILACSVSLAACGATGQGDGNTVRTPFDQRDCRHNVALGARPVGDILAPWLRRSSWRAVQSCARSDGRPLVYQGERRESDRVNHGYDLVAASTGRPRYRRCSSDRESAWQTGRRSQRAARRTRLHHCRVA